MTSRQFSSLYFTVMFVVLFSYTVSYAQDVTPVLPRAVTATPSPLPPSPPSDHPLLDEGSSNLLESESFAFQVSGQLSIENESESAVVDFTTNGTIAHFTSFQSAEIHHSTTLSIDLSGETHTMIVEQIIINETLYIRGESVNTGEKTVWYELPFRSVLNEVFPFQEVLEILDNQSVEADSNTENAILELLTLGKYVVTENKGEINGEVHFETEVQIEKLLRSEKDLAFLISLLVKLSGANVDLDELEDGMQFFQMAISFLVPEVELTIDQYLSLQQAEPIVSRVEIDFEIETTLLSGDLLSPDMLSADPVSVEFNVVVALSGYNEEYPIDIPTDTERVTHLSDIGR